jgi:hypothetical protein
MRSGSNGVGSRINERLTKTLLDRKREPSTAAGIGRPRLGRSRFQGGADVHEQAEQMVGVAGRCDKVEVLIKGLGGHLKCRRARTRWVSREAWQAAGPAGAGQTAPQGNSP